MKTIHKMGTTIAVIGTILLVVGGALQYFGTWKSGEEDKKERADASQADKQSLIEQIRMKDNELHSIRESNSRLEAQNDKLFNKIEVYEKSLAEKQKEIDGLKVAEERTRRYVFYSSLNVFGRPFSGRNVHFTSPLSDLMNKVIYLDPENSNDLKDLKIKTSQDSFEIINQVVHDFPDFPFGYSIRAVMLKSVGRPWKKDAIKSREILLITTTIGNHQLSHDFFLQQITAMIEEND